MNAWRPMSGWLLAIAAGTACPGEDRPPASWQYPSYRARYLIEVPPLLPGGYQDLVGELQSVQVLLPDPGPPPAPGRAPLLVCDLHGRPLPGKIESPPPDKEANTSADILLTFPYQRGVQRYYVFVSPEKGASASPLDYAGALVPMKLRTGPLRLRTPLLERLNGVADLRGVVLAPARPGGFTTHQRLMIDDFENPFAQGDCSHDWYTSVYDGYLYCAEGGDYRLALDADEVAWVLIDGQPVLRQLGPGDYRRGHTSQRFQWGKWPEQASVKLRAGVHRINVYHFERDGEQACRLAWQPPGEDTLDLIPPDAFVWAYPGRLASYQTRDGRSHPAFDVRVSRRVFLNGSRHYLELALTPTADGAAGAAEYRVDGKPVKGESARAFIPAQKTVLLELLGPRSEVLFTRRVRFAPELGRSTPLHAELALRAAPPFIYEDETAQLYLEVVRARGLFGPLQLEARAYDSQGRPAPPTGVKPVEVGERGYRKYRFALDCRKLGNGARVEFKLLLRQVVVSAFSVRLIGSRQKWPELFAADDWLGLLPEGSRAVVLLPREDEAQYRKFRLLKLAARPETKQVMLIGDDLAAIDELRDGMLGQEAGKASAATERPPRAASPETESPAGPLAQAMVSRMRRRDAEARLETVTYGEALRASRQARPGERRAAGETGSPASGGGVVPALALLAHLERRLAVPRAGALEHTAAVISPGSADALANTPEHTFARTLDVLIDRLRRVGIGRIVILGPLPTLGRVDLAAKYERAAATVAREHQVRLVSVRRWLLQEADWRRHFLVPGEVSVYGRVPGRELTAEIARRALEAAGAD